MKQSSLCGLKTKLQHTMKLTTQPNQPYSENQNTVMANCAQAFLPHVRACRSLQHALEQEGNRCHKQRDQS